ncbi:MAG: TonB-dependent receptor, partial [Chitinophagaceae bacterium]
MDRKRSQCIGKILTDRCRNGKAFLNNFRGTLTASKAIEKHSFKVLAGASREDYRYDVFSAFRDGYVLPNYPVLNTGSTGFMNNAGTASEWALQSLFGRINYDWNGRYLLEINGRYDGSSRFPAGQRF